MNDFGQERGKNKGLKSRSSTLIFLPICWLSKRIIGCFLVGTAWVVNPRSIKLEHPLKQQNMLAIGSWYRNLSILWIYELCSYVVWPEIYQHQQQTCRLKQNSRTEWKRKQFSSKSRNVILAAHVVGLTLFNLWYLKNRNFKYPYFWFRKNLWMEILKISIVLKS